MEEKRDWNIYRYKIDAGWTYDVCPTDSDAWEWFDIPRSTSLEVRATVHSTIESKAREVMETLNI